MTARSLFFSSLIYAIVLFALWPLLTIPLRYFLSRSARNAGSYVEDRLGGIIWRETTTCARARPIKKIRIEIVRQAASTADTTEGPPRACPIAEHGRNCARRLRGPEDRNTL